VTEPEAERIHPGTTFPPVEPDAELSRKNLAWGFALFLVALVIAGGTVVVALVYESIANY
jgi:hypothetical protein